MKASPTWGVWNPAKPYDTFNAIYGPGVATYRIDEAQIVHLHFRPKGKGDEVEVSGPIPEALFHKSANQRRQERFLVVYLVGLVVVFALTFLLSSGTTATRLVRGGVAALIAMVALVIVVRVLLVLLSTSAIRRSKGLQKPTNVAPQPMTPPETVSSDSDELWRRVDSNEQIARRYLDEHKQPDRE